MRSLSRTELRENIFKITFSSWFHDDSEIEGNINKYFDNLTGDNDEKIELSEDDMAYISEKAGKVVEKADEIDRLIDNASKGWSVTRIGKAELAILRLAVYEMFYDDDIPTNVAINEAIELTKRYGEVSAPAFVNGILASISQTRE